MVLRTRQRVKFYSTFILFLQPCKMGIFLVNFIGVHLLYNVVLVFYYTAKRNSYTYIYSLSFLDFLPI